MGILDGKNIVVTGVLTDASLAYGVAKLAIEQGAQVMLTGAGRGLSITERTARKLSADIKVVEFDVTVDEHIVSAREAAKSQFGRVDGSAAFAASSDGRPLRKPAWRAHGRGLSPGDPAAPGDVG